MTARFDRSLSILTLCAAALAPAALAGDRVLLVEGVVDAPPERVWELFTTATGIESWMAPHAEVDLRIGGSIRTNYRPEGEMGDETTITNRILSYEPGRMISLQNVEAPEGFPHADALGETWSVMYFEPAGEGRTRVRLVGLGWGEDDASDAAYEFFRRGNAYTLEQLRRAVKGEETSTPSSDGADLPD